MITDIKQANKVRQDFTLNYMVKDAGIVMVQARRGKDGYYLRVGVNRRYRNDLPLKYRGLRIHVEAGWTPGRTLVGQA